MGSKEGLGAAWAALPKPEPGAGFLNGYFLPNEPSARPLPCG